MEQKPPPVMMCLREEFTSPDEIKDGWWAPGGKCADCGTGIFVPTPETLEREKDTFAVGMDQGRVGVGKITVDVAFCCGPCTIERAYKWGDWQSAVALSELVRTVEEVRRGH